VAAGDEFRVNSFTFNAQYHPTAAMDDGGDFVIAWASYTQDGSGDGIYAQRFNAAGAPLGEEFRVNTATLEAQVMPSAAMDAEGNFVIAWASYLQDESDYGIYAQRYSAAGLPQGNETRVNTATAAAWQWTPTAIMSSSGKS
jgi:hypothetical protein